jgi:hypothetical protein
MNNEHVWFDGTGDFLAVPFVKHSGCPAEAESPTIVFKSLIVGVSISFFAKFASEFFIGSSSSAR